MRFDAFQGTLQAFAEHAGLQRHWEIAQATFSLQNLPVRERAAALRWLRNVTERALIVEFDVPRFPGMFAPEHFDYVVQRYEVGLTEYVDDVCEVAQGFLMPVMCGYFDPTQSRVNYEQPAEDWAAQLRDAGFASVSCQSLDAYWWATAVLIDASSA
jgi:hypothetical protein